MKIGVVNNVYLNNNRALKKNSFSFKSDVFERIAFRGNLPYELLKSIPDGYTLDDLIFMAQQEENLRGIGANSKVYNIPYLNDYVLKVLNKDDPNGIKINEFPPTINMGQPVWQNDKNRRMLILRKVEGMEHSIPFWSHTIWNPKTQKPQLVTKEQAQVYFDGVDKLAKMPQEAFNEICYKAKLLDDKEYKIDSINPNNLIVDDNEIHIIDYFKVKPHELCCYKNCSYDLIAIMLDFTLLPEYFEKMSSEQKTKFLNNAKVILEKVQKGSVHAGLSTDVEIYKTFINETSKWFVPMSAVEADGREHIRLYDYRADDFLMWLDNLK